MYVGREVLDAVKKIVSTSEVSPPLPLGGPRWQAQANRSSHWTPPPPPAVDPQVLKEDDANWPEADRVGCQELEVVFGKEHICFRTTKIGSLMDVQNSQDPEGLKVFYYLVQDIKCLVLSLITLHFKIKPI